MTPSERTKNVESAIFSIREKRKSALTEVEDKFLDRVKKLQTNKFRTMGNKFITQCVNKRVTPFIKEMSKKHSVKGSTIKMVMNDYE